MIKISVLVKLCIAFIATTFITCLFFHFVPSILKVFPKVTPTFNNTFITESDIERIIGDYNNASLFEKMAMRNDPFNKNLLDHGVIGKRNTPPEEEMKPMLKAGDPEFDRLVDSLAREELRYKEQREKDSIAVMESMGIYAEPVKKKKAKNKTSHKTESKNQYYEVYYGPNPRDVQRLQLSNMIDQLIENSPNKEELLRVRDSIRNVEVIDLTE